MERDRYHELRLLERAGAIGDLECQPRWEFVVNGSLLCWRGRAVRYTADFRYVDRTNNRVVVEDVKGNHRSRDVHLRLALMESVHGITVQLVQPRRAGRPRR